MVFFWICGLLLDLRVGHVGFYQRVLQRRLRRGLLAIRDYSGTQSNCGSFLWFSYVFQGNIFRYIPYTCLSFATSVWNVYAVEGIIIDVMDGTHLKNEIGRSTCKRKPRTDFSGLPWRLNPSKSMSARLLQAIKCARRMSLRKKGRICVCCLITIA